MWKQFVCEPTTFALGEIVDIVVEGTQPPAFPAAICYPYVEWLSAVIEESLVPSI